MQRLKENLELVTKKLEQYLAKSKAPLIIQENDRYHVFKDYIIKENDGAYELYKKDTYIETVTSTAVALSWCVFDKYKKWNNARELLKSDRQVDQYMFEIQNRKSILEKTKDQHLRSLLKIRIYEDVERLKEAKRNVNKCVNLTKYIKIKGFNNESK